eukprot:scaffold88833_cov40-Attheya_sp.AAC.2
MAGEEEEVNQEGTRKSKRARNVEPDSPSSLNRLAGSKNSSRALRNLAAVGGHGGRPKTESDPSLQWQFSPATTTSTPILCGTCTGTPNQNEQASTTSTTPTFRSATKAASLPTTTPTPTSGKKRPVPSPCVVQFDDPSVKLKGNRILNIGKIQQAVCENMVCKQCVKQRETNILDSFATHLDSLDATEKQRSSVELLKEFQASKKKSELSGEICISSETQYGIATSITFSCYSTDQRKKVHECGEVNAEEATYFVGKKKEDVL